MCPFLEAADPRCGQHLTLDNLSHALEYCACDYRECPVYRELNSYAQGRERSDQRHITAAG